MGVGLCERCNPLGLRDVSASQVHGTVFIGVAVAIVGLALIARLAITGLGPFPRPSMPSCRSVTPYGSHSPSPTRARAAGQTTCRVTTASNQGGGPNAFVLTPELQPGQKLTFDQLVTELGTADTDLVVECRTP